ncbi:MAG: FtsW/RodA/SpoVE family cell cycle protein [Bacillota bacterium]|nr:FtsW/RodA/SpoVE family cell cycle protein [Bacillota bacterium]
MDNNVIFSVILVTVRVLLPLLAIIIVYQIFASMRRHTRDNKPLIMLLNKYTKEQIPVLCWENSVGRSRSNDIVINDPTVSRTHIVLLRRDKGWLITDIDSKAGVLVNGKKVSERAKVFIDDEIKIGNTVLVIHQGTDYSKKNLQVKYHKEPIAPFKLLMMITFFHLLMTFGACYSTDITNFQPFIPFGIFTALSWTMFGVSMLIMNRVTFEMESLAIFLSGIGVIMLCRQNIHSCYTQIITCAIGMIAFLILIKFIEDPDRITKWRFVIMGIAVGFLLMNMAFGHLRGGEQNWIQIGGFTIQPSEFVKIAYIFVGASSLDILLTRKNLMEFIIFTAICIGALFFMGDFGTALIFFVTFLMISFMRSGDFKTLILALAAAVFGGTIVLRFKPYVANRFKTWGHALQYAQTGGYQQARVLTYIASGGLFGVGIGNGCLKYVAASESDLVFGLISEEMGFLMAVIIAVSIVALVFYSRAVTTRSRSTFYSISACCTAGLLVFQAGLNIFGATDVLPLTGVTLPFISAGGSSIISCWALLAFLKAADEKTYAAKRRRTKAISKYEEEPDDEDFDEDYDDE